jgi:uncharacterized protein YjbI with pentapeptide repeats
MVPIGTGRNGGKQWAAAAVERWKAVKCPVFQRWNDANLRRADLSGAILRGASLI